MPQLFQHNARQLHLSSLFSGAGIRRMSAAYKINAIWDWFSCRSITKVRAFIRLNGYYRRFAVRTNEKECEVYADQAMSRRVWWVEEKSDDRVILALPKNEGCFVLDTNASDFGLGAILSQRQTETPAEAPTLKTDRKLCASQSKESFEDVIKSRKQIRNDTKGIVGCAFQNKAISSEFAGTSLRDSDSPRCFFVVTTNIQTYAADGQMFKLHRAVRLWRRTQK